MWKPPCAVATWLALIALRKREHAVSLRQTSTDDVLVKFGLAILLRLEHDTSLELSYLLFSSPALPTRRCRPLGTRRPADRRTCGLGHGPVWTAILTAQQSLGFAPNMSIAGHKADL